jgi:hypothetical protein
MGFWNRLRHHLFDRPISRPELEMFLRLLPVALAETDTHDGFERLMRQMLQQYSGLGTEHIWRFALMHLEQYRRPFEMDAMPRTLAQRFMADPPIPQAEKTGFEPSEKT